MSTEYKNLLELVFPNGLPGDWHEKLADYISKLGTYKTEDLLKEPNRLQDEKHSIKEQTQDLAVTNYKTFIETAECSRQLFSQFSNIETKLDELLCDIPKFDKECEEFCETTSGINHLRKLNSLTLTRNAQLLEVLELPQLMNSFINDEMYEDALELASYVRKLYSKHSDIPIFQSITNDVDQAWLLMLHQLLGQLRKDLTLPKCLQIVGHLRRMEVFTETELRIKFLQTRNAFLQLCLSGIPKENVNHHLTKTIEVTRVNLFNIVTQYRAIFNDDEHSLLVSSNTQQVNQNILFYSWIKDRVADFLRTLEEDLQQGVTSLDSILEQCMYFGLSFSKVGCDFRPQLVEIFTSTITSNFEASINKALSNFKENIKHFTLINKNHPNVPWKTKNDDPLQPPDSLLEFYPLAEFLNNLLDALNHLRLCAPLAIITEVVRVLEKSLLTIANSILVLYAQEQQAFTANSKEAFARLCMSFADDLVPYVQKCVHVIYPPTSVSAKLGVSVQSLQDNAITFLDRNAIVYPIKHLLPVKVDPVLEVEMHKEVEEEIMVQESQEEDVSLEAAAESSQGDIVDTNS